MKPKDLELIGIDHSEIEEGDAIVAIGKKGGAIGSGIYKLGRSLQKASFH